MRLTSARLRQIIKEEVSRLREMADVDEMDMGMGDMMSMPDPMDAARDVLRVFNYWKSMSDGGLPQFQVDDMIDVLEISREEALDIAQAADGVTVGAMTVSYDPDSELIRIRTARRTGPGRMTRR